MKKVLVTGCAGFIGSHVCEALLLRGVDVAGVDDLDEYYDVAMKHDNLAQLRAAAASGGARFCFVKADVCDEKAVAAAFSEHAPQAVVHMAALAGVRSSVKHPARYARVNVEGTVTLLEACRKNAVRRFVYASSSSVYGNAEKVPTAEEDRTDRPLSPYAATKKAAELMCRAYCELWGMRAACLRFFTVYGERQRPDLAIHKFARLMLAGMEIPVFGPGDTARDYTYIADAARGVMSALDWTAAPGGAFEVFNLGSGRPVALNDMITVLEGALGTVARVARLPLQSTDPRVTFADISKARRVLGYEPSTPFEEGIERFVAWALSRRP